MADSSKETADVLKQVLQEYGSKANLAYNSNILVSDVNVAETVYAETESIRNSFGPKITIASRGQAAAVEDGVSQMQGVTTKQLDTLEMDTYSHAIFALAGEDPKFILEGFKWMIHSLQPKGIAIVTSLKVESGKVEGPDGQFTLGLEEKMLYQSKGKVGKLQDVMEYAGFEKGKIRSHERTTEAAGRKTEAEVVLAMKWDQLTG